MQNTCLRRKCENSDEVSSMTIYTIGMLQFRVFLCRPRRWYPISQVTIFENQHRSFELYCIHRLFFISLSAPMISTASVLPVAF